MILEVTFEAHDDLVNIYNYSLINFGEIQANKYLEKIEGAFNFLLKEPFAGYSRSDVPSLYNCWKVESHCVIYRIEDDILYVVRVLHGNMNFNYHF